MRTKTVNAKHVALATRLVASNSRKQQDSKQHGFWKYTAFATAGKDLYNPYSHGLLYV